MILLALLKQLEIDGKGEIDTDLFYEAIPIGQNGKPKQGSWITSRGTAVSRVSVYIQAFDIYFRYDDKLAAAKKAQDILEYLEQAYSDICTLPAVEEYSSPEYTNVRVVPVSGVESLGMDEQGRVVFLVSGEVRYNKS